ncbi:BH3511 [Halalkalibacterium halodurans C-125]|uniref:BH3511 protein n=1 Tax=Halalkalibacterium halodurans (strain ATCC BAA-125 / DSM 18197 / FERM 7344 / JCM 9153 / C-125) TaxID=272558 RepID=Q9K762_HALH5|nr:hypothetical protein [Halalkalibacterium halodurans]BAB07230.1 BH3511 [Halalkalibacterium halodurans C-125]
MEVYDVAVIPIITGLVGVFTQLGLRKKFAPIVSLVLGLLIGIFYVYPGDIKGGILVGLMLGLSATGLYSGVKNTKELAKGED